LVFWGIAVAVKSGVPEAKPGRRLRSDKDAGIGGVGMEVREDRCKKEDCFAGERRQQSNHLSVSWGLLFLL